MEQPLEKFEKAFRACNNGIALLAVPFFGWLGWYYFTHHGLLYSSVAKLILALFMAGLIGYAVFLLLLKYHIEALKKIEVLIIAPLVTLFLIAEALLWVGEPIFGRSPDPFLNINKPNMKIAFAVRPGALPGVEERGTFATDSQGFRTTHHIPYSRKDPGTKRIVFIGGSTTEQFYLDNQKTAPALLEKKLNDRYAPQRLRFETINAGKAGLATADHYFLLQEMTKLKPDYVVILAGVNDVFAYLRTLGASANDPNLYVATKRETIHYYLSRSQVLRRAYYAKAVLLGVLRDDIVDVVETDRFERKREKRQAMAISSMPEHLKTPPAYFEKNLDAIIALARENHVPLILLTQPVMWQKNMPPKLDAILWATPGDDGPLRFSTGDLEEAMERANDVTRRKAQDGVAIIDLAKMLPKDTSVYYDDVHFNNGGAEKIADMLFRYFVGEITSTATNS